ncbi:MAG: chromate efflux transporter [Betaproteobacteria bacterium]|nr:chromate efflux transporter [Betaproteobacteria bacterium]
MCASPTTATPVPAAPRLGEAFRFWLWLGCVSFGGPAGQIAIMHRELVERRRWISEKRYLHALNYCMVLPGPEAQQLATYIGWLLHRTPGALIAGSLFVLPSLVLLVLLSWIYMAFGDQPLIAGLFYGIKPAVTAIVVQAAHRIGSRALRNGVLWAIAAAAFVAILALRVPFPFIILGAALVGYLGGRMAPAHFELGGRHAIAAGANAPAVIDDETPPPAHAKFCWPRFFKVLAVSLLLWGVVVAVLRQDGMDGTLTRMGVFFTKAALLTFGGAYAVLPYVFQGAVEQYHWLSASQMIDGLALGETTPGPLIMVVAFVGFVGGWTHALLGPDALFAAGALAATVVTFFTFLPSFAFILLGGPAVESTRGNPSLIAPLTAITAAVVGVILNLALFFSSHVLWPEGFDGSLDIWSLIIGVGAAVALIRFDIGVIPVIGACALAGLLISMI